MSRQQLLERLSKVEGIVLQSEEGLLSIGVVMTNHERRALDAIEGLSQCKLLLLANDGDTVAASERVVDLIQQYRERPSMGPIPPPCERCSLDCLSECIENVMITTRTIVAGRGGVESVSETAMVPFTHHTRFSFAMLHCCKFPSEGKVMLELMIERATDDDTAFLNAASAFMPFTV